MGTYQYQISILMPANLNRLAKFHFDTLSFSKWFWTTVENSFWNTTDNFTFDAIVSNIFPKNKIHIFSFFFALIEIFLSLFCRHADHKQRRLSIEISDSWWWFCPQLACIDSIDTWYLGIVPISSVSQNYKKECSA